MPAHESHLQDPTEELFVPLLIRSITLSVCLSLLFLLPLPVQADGVQTGNIVGRVVDSEGLPLPGVDVRLEGSRSPRSVQTDDDGRFRFPQLPIGTYRVRAELLGLVAFENDVRTYIGKTATVKLSLQPTVAGEATSTLPGAVLASDQIQVLAVAPLIDRFETGVRTSISRQFLEQLPVERFYQSVALLQPGVVGGGDGNPNTSGSLRSNNLFLVDGVDTTDPTTGLFGLNLSYDAVKDVDVTTAAPSVDSGRASGAVLNVVTQSGDNRFRGSARWFGTNRDWDSDYQGLPGLERELGAANGGSSSGRSGELDNTFAATLAGPLNRDSLWFFGAFEDGNESFLRPTFEGTVWDEEAGISSSAVKLNWQLGTHSVVGQFTADDASFGSFAPFNQEPGENRAARSPARLNDEFVLPFPGDIFAIEQRTQTGEFGKLEWNTVIGQNFTLSARGAFQNRSLERSALNQRADIAPHFVPTRYESTADEFGEFFSPEDFAVFNGVTGVGDENRERQQANFAGSWFLVSGPTDHEFRFGVDYQSTESDQRIQIPGQEGIDPFTGLAVSGQIFFDDDFRDACFFDGNCRPFDTETGAFQPLDFLNFWQRPRRSTTQETVAAHLSDALTLGRWLISAGLRFESVTGEDGDGRQLMDDTSISPRLAVKYDAKGDGSVLLSAVYSRFVEAFPQRLMDDFLRMETFSGFTAYTWADPFDSPECETVDPRQLDSPCWQFSSTEDFFARQQATPNLDLERATVEEVVLGFERQLTSNTALRLNLIDRRWLDLWDDRFEFGPDDLLVELANLPEAERTYRGVLLQVQRQYSAGWQLLGSYTWSEAEGNLFQSTGRSTFADFAQISDVNLVNRNGFAPFDRTHQLKLFATYRIPLGRSFFALGGAFRYEDGAPYQGEQFEDLGVRFLNPRGSLQLEDFVQLDLSLAFDFPLQAERELEVKLEVFNLTDEQSVLAVETDIDSNRFELPRDLGDVQSPRSFRLTFGFLF